MKMNLEDLAEQWVGTDCGNPREEQDAARDFLETAGIDADKHGERFCELVDGLKPKDKKKMKRNIQFDAQVQLSNRKIKRALSILEESERGRQAVLDLKKLFNENSQGLDLRNAQAATDLVKEFFLNHRRGFLPV